MVIKPLDIGTGNGCGAVRLTESIEPDAKEKTFDLPILGAFYTKEE